MKITYLLAILFLVMATTQAQQKRDTIHATATAKKKAKVNDQLGLDKKQAASLKASSKEYKTEKDKVQADTKLTEAEKKAKLKDLKKEKKAQTDAILTPEQRAKAKELKAEKKKEKKKKP